MSIVLFVTFAFNINNLYAIDTDDNNTTTNDTVDDTTTTNDDDTDNNNDNENINDYNDDMENDDDTNDEDADDNMVTNLLYGVGGIAIGSLFTYFIVRNNRETV